jgi:C4-dicarboxylate-specific signal transduction histidine kinase
MTSTFDTTYKKRASSREEHEPAPEFNPAKHVSPNIAHELNNILTIVQGYADRLIMKHPGDATLQTQLKSISDAARRAATIIRDATPQIYTTPAHRTPPPEPEPAAA